MSTYWTPGLSAYLLRHPPTVWTMMRAGWRLRRTGWWRRAPFLPLPYRPYWSFRVATLGADAGTPLTPAAMADAAKWSLRQPVGR